MARGGRRVSIGRVIMQPGLLRYLRLSRAAKSVHQGKGPQEPLYACRLCPTELPIKVLESDRKGHLRRSHAGQDQGRTLRVLFRRVKRGER